MSYVPEEYFQTEDLWLTAKSCTFNIVQNNIHIYMNLMTSFADSFDLLNFM